MGLNKNSDAWDDAKTYADMCLTLGRCSAQDTITQIMARFTDLTVDDARKIVASVSSMRTVPSLFNPTGRLSSIPKPVIARNTQVAQLVTDIRCPIAHGRTIIVGANQGSSYSIMVDAVATDDWVNHIVDDVYSALGNGADIAIFSCDDGYAGLETFLGGLNAKLSRMAFSAHLCRGLDDDDCNLSDNIFD